MKSIKLHYVFLIGLLIVVGCNTDPDVKVSHTPNLSVYPNPAIDYVRIDVGFAGTSTLEVFDSEGELALKATMSDDSYHILDLNNRPAGIYHVIVTNGAQTVTQEFIKL